MKKGSEEIVGFLNKKGQEEMTGFALIIIIVAIIGIVLLAFMLRKPSDAKFDNFEIQQFLDSVSRVQSTCLMPLDYTTLRISDLVQECFSNSAAKCQSGVTVCKSLESSLSDIVYKSYNIAPSSPYVGFKLDVIFEASRNSSIPPKIVINVSSGTCANNYFGGESILPEKERTGNFITRMQLCLSNSTN